MIELSKMKLDSVSPGSIVSDSKLNIELSNMAATNSTTMGKRAVVYSANGAKSSGFISGSSQQKNLFDQLDNKITIIKPDLMGELASIEDILVSSGAFKRFLISNPNLKSISGYTFESSNDFIALGTSANVDLDVKFMFKQIGVSEKDVQKLYNDAASWWAMVNSGVDVTKLNEITEKIVNERTALVKAFSNYSSYLGGKLFMYEDGVYTYDIMNKAFGNGFLNTVDYKFFYPAFYLYNYESGKRVPSYAVYIDPMSTITNTQYKDKSEYSVELRFFYNVHKGLFSSNYELNRNGKTY